MAALVREVDSVVNDIFGIPEDRCTILSANRVALEEKMRVFGAGGARSLKVVTDFDFTLTRFSIDGNRGRSCHKVLEYSGFLPEEALAEAKRLHDFYYPREVDPLLDLATKTAFMEEWCLKAHEVLVRSQFTRGQVRGAVVRSLTPPRPRPPASASERGCTASCSSSGAAMCPRSSSAQASQMCWRMR